MKALIITPPDGPQFEMARIASSRLYEYGGVAETEYFYSSDKPDAHYKKLSALLMFHEPMVLCDSDYWMVQESKIPTASGSLVVAAPCHGVDKFYTGTSVPRYGAFCSCFVCLDMGDQNIRRAVERAVDAQKKATPEQALLDERFLNIAMHEDPKIQVAVLSSNWNWCAQRYHEHVVAIHAAQQPNKLNWLNHATGLSSPLPSVN